MASSIQELRAAQAAGLVIGTVVRPYIIPDHWPRKEIDEFITDAPVCNLFLLALERLQQMDDNDPWSYFGISTIHGRPFTAWNGITQATAIRTAQFPAWDPALFANGNIPNEEDIDSRLWNRSTQREGKKDAGYCSHGSVLFPSWHRPYVTMMEQALCLKMHEIAQEYAVREGRSTYIEAAYRFRMPYFDPLMARVLIEHRKPHHWEWKCGAPAVLSACRVYVHKPGWGVLWDWIDNPLYQYKFPTVSHLDHTPKYAVSDPRLEFYKLWAPNGYLPRAPRPYPSNVIPPNLRTVRTPSEHGYSNHSRMADSFDIQVRPQGVSLYNVLSQERPYVEFATSTFRSDKRLGEHRTGMITGREGFNSIEGFHDAIHTWAGKQSPDGVVTGHMLKLEWAAFDPMFWLHHCNIDRLYEMWRLRFPARAAEKFKLNLFEGNYTEPEGYTQTQDSPLLPFLKSPDHFWTTADCRDTYAMGYYYREQNLTREELLIDINQKYFWCTVPESGPPARSLTGFPVDFGPRPLPQSNAPCLGATTLIDSENIDNTRGTFPRPAFRELPGPRPFHVTRSMNSETSGVEPRSRRSVVLSGEDASSTDSRRELRSTAAAVTSATAKIELTSIREWYLTAAYEKFSLGGSFGIHFFIGEVPIRKEWSKHHNYAGMIYNLATETDAGCENCETQASAGLMKANLLSLTNILHTYLASRRSFKPFTVKTLGREDIIPFLTKHLQWRLVDTENQVVQPEKIKGLRIMVTSCIFHPPPSQDQAGTWEDFEPAMEVTHGKPGGASHGDM